MIANNRNKLAIPHGNDSRAPCAESLLGDGLNLAEPRTARRLFEAHLQCYLLFYYS